MPRRRTRPSFLTALAGIVGTALLTAGCTSAPQDGGVVESPRTFTTSPAPTASPTSVPVQQRPADPLRAFTQAWKEEHPHRAVPTPLAHQQGTGAVTVPLKQAEGKRPKYVVIYVQCAPESTVQITAGSGKSRSTCGRNRAATVGYGYQDAGRSVTVKVPERARFWVLVVPMDKVEAIGI